MEKLGRKQAIREKCIDCCGGFIREVKRCTAYTCPLWRWRMGREVDVDQLDDEEDVQEDDENVD